MQKDTRLFAVGLFSFFPQTSRCSERHLSKAWSKTLTGCPRVCLRLNTSLLLPSTWDAPRTDAVWISFAKKKLSIHADSAKSLSATGFSNVG